LFIDDEAPEKERKQKRPKQSSKSADNGGSKSADNGETNSPSSVSIPNILSPIFKEVFLY